MAATDPGSLAQARKIAVCCAIGLETESVFRTDRGSATDSRLVTSHMLKVGPSLTPLIEDCVENSCANLSFPRQLVDVYIAPSVESNAYCTTHDGRCAVVINSALVEALGPSELSFVIGHEIGHFLVPEFATSSRGSLEASIKSRRAELTMDRIGLVASRDLNMACLAKLKMLSGLSRRHLKLDVVEIISDWRRELTQGAHEMLTGSTHPPPGLRIHALVRFHGTSLYRSIVGLQGGTDPREANDEILDELGKYVDSRETSLIRASLIDLSCALVSLAAALGVAVRKSSFTSGCLDVNDGILRESVGNILSISVPEERLSLARNECVECLRRANAAAPELTSRYLKELEEKEPAILNQLKELGAEIYVAKS